MKQQTRGIGQSRRLVALGALFLTLVHAAPTHATSFSAGSLIIPMDLTYQDHGMLQAYGLVHALLRHGIPVHWIINPAKIDSDSCANTPQGCWWDCRVQGDGTPCPYYTMSPDLTLSATVVSDDSGRSPPGTAVALHGYRGGPFVIEAAWADQARPIIDAWNSPAAWDANPWAARPVFSVVTVHQATQDFIGTTARLLQRAPTIGILADGAEGVLAAVLRAAGIPQSDGAAFTDAPCGPGACGPGTARPDFIPLEALVAFPDPCPEQSLDWVDTLLINSGRLPRLHRYAMIATAGFGPDLRETFLCEDGPCETQDASCLTSPLVFHGHQIQRHLRAYSEWGELFALGEAVFGFENTPFDPDLPVADHAGYSGSLFTRIEWPTCPCDFPGFSCVPGGCYDWEGLAQDCCLPDDPAWRGAGVGPVPVANPGEFTRVGLVCPTLQLDGDWHLAPGPGGAFGTTTPAGSSREFPSYEPDGHVLTEAGDFLLISQQQPRRRVHYLADLPLSVETPVTGHPETQNSRVFLNTLIGARYAWDLEWLDLHGSLMWGQPPDCVGNTGGVTLRVNLRTFGNFPLWTLDELTIDLALPDGVEVDFCEGDPVVEPHRLSWHFTNVEHRNLYLTCLLVFHTRGAIPITIDLAYGWGTDPDTNAATSNTVTIALPAAADTDGDGRVDCEDPAPEDPYLCGDRDWDGRDDCALPGPEPDAGDDEPEPWTPHKNGCFSTAGARGRPGGLFWPFCLLALGFAWRRRRP